jgi:hypothetical protein
MRWLTVTLRQKIAEGIAPSMVYPARTALKHGLPLSHSYKREAVLLTLGPAFYSAVMQLAARDPIYLVFNRSHQQQ